MGNAGHSSEGTRRVVEAIRAGAIGPVREVHAWTDRPIWPQAVDRPATSRRFPARCTGTSGSARRRSAPITLRTTRSSGAAGGISAPAPWETWAATSSTPPSGHSNCVPRGASRPRVRRLSPHPETAPAWSIVRYEFAAKGNRPPVKLIWYDGGKLPPLELFDGHAPGKGSNGSLFVGEKGRLLVGGQRGRGYRLLPEREFAGLCRAQAHAGAALPATMPSGSRPARPESPRARTSIIPAALTELVLLGNVALRAGRRIEWDAAGMKVHQRFSGRPLHPSRIPPGWAAWHL